MPEVGRFISEDVYKGALVEPISLNLYIYCANNPVKYTDPSGNVYVMLDYINEKLNGKISYKTTKYTFLGIAYKREIEITIGDKTKKYKYQKIDGHILIDSDELVEDFCVDRSDVEHQAGDTFNTMDDTALAWSLKYYELSNDENNKDNPKKYNPREYASAIYKNNCEYSFGEPNIGSYNQVMPPSAPSGYAMVAAIHSHPDLGSSTYFYSKRFKNRLWGPYYGDYKWVSENVNELPLYLANGRGEVLIAEKIKTGKVEDRVVFRNIKY